MKQVQDEIRTKLGDNQERVTEDDLDQLHCLKLVVKRDIQITPNHSTLVSRFVNSTIADKGLELQLLPIGSGKRICPETRIATVELGLLNLLYFFDWELPQGKRVKDIDLEETGIITLSKRTALEPVPVLHH
ncbi:hypothetical protein HID58_083532 [Brassica napus]|uniref:Cytochrome P450 n=1 Tax=Brassica napus TaxID=3708 RepID=A0ABQ7YGJ6_BRANA|nr:hypothetical protein HID58_083532 [Brassica napus]